MQTANQSNITHARVAQRIATHRVLCSGHEDLNETTWTNIVGVIKATTSKYTPEPPTRTPEDVSERQSQRARERRGWTSEPLLVRTAAAKLDAPPDLTQPLLTPIARTLLSLHHHCPFSFAFRFSHSILSSSSSDSLPFISFRPCPLR